MTATMVQPRVALIDDHQLMREDVATTLREGNCEPVFVTLQDGSTEQIVAMILETAQTALCDQRLGSMTSRTQGAEIVAELTRRRVPAILYSERKEEDTPELRRYFDLIPRFLNREELSQSDLLATFASISREFEEGVPKERRPYRTLIRVEEMLGRNRAAIAIPAWHVNELVEISTDDIEPDIRTRVTAGTRLFAKVNLHAALAQSIFVKEFELAVPPEPSDGLA